VLSAQAGIKIVDLVKVSETRVSRTVFDYAFKVVATNVSENAFSAVSARLTSAGSGTQVVSGNVNFSAIQTGAQQTSQDTIVIRQDRTVAVNLASWQWVFDGTPVAPLEIPLPDNALTVSGLESTTFVPKFPTIVYDLVGTTFDTSTGATSASINGVAASSSQFAVSANRITFKPTLNDGFNTIRLKAYDQFGRAVYSEKAVWSGAYTLQVRVVDQAGALLLGPTKVTVSLGDDASVQASGTATNGVVSFNHLPARTLLIKAESADGYFGDAGDLGSASVVYVRVAKFNAPSSVNNNDFSLGLQGWQSEGNTASIVLHEEAVGPSNVSLKSTLEVTSQPAKVPRAARAKTTAVAASSSRSKALAQSASADNWDMSLSTSGEGVQSISRTFTVPTGTTSASIRYRFITSEVPGGWFGSKYNDYFSVTIRTKSRGLIAGETNSMNGLGLAAFDANGSTAWRTFSMQIDPAGDEVQVEIHVANVADGFLDSSVVVDYVATKQDQVFPSLAWSKANGGLTLGYKVQSGPTDKDVDIRVYWAAGSASSSVIGAPIYTLKVPAGTADGVGPNVSVTGAFLSDDPGGTTNLVAVVSESSTAAVADVRVAYGAQANAAAVSLAMVDVVKDGLRAAGVTTATITSTARSPADQARAMFNNLVNPAHTVAVNTANQLALYSAPGDAVINAFTAATAGMTLAQITANATTIKATMEAEVIAQGPSNVSHHCADPTVVSVIDVGASAFGGSSNARFLTLVTPRVDKLIDELATNNAYHLEKNVD